MIPESEPAVGVGKEGREETQEFRLERSSSIDLGVGCPGFRRLGIQVPGIGGQAGLSGVVEGARTWKTENVRGRCVKSQLP